MLHVAGWQVPLQPQQPAVDVVLLLAVQCRPDIILVLPEYIVHSLKGGGHCHTTHICNVYATWVGVLPQYLLKGCSWVACVCLCCCPATSDSLRA